MSTWDDKQDDDVYRTPFTVVLSVGSAMPSVGGPDETDSTSHSDRSHGTEPVSSRSWTWQPSVSALLHAVFARGGTITARLDDELLPFLWGSAQVHAQAVPAEHGETPTEPAVYALTSAMDEHPDPKRSERSDSVAGAFEATGLVRVQPFTRDIQQIPGPGPHFGVVLWPDETIEEDLPLLYLTESIAVVRWWDAPPVEQLGPDTEDIAVEGDAPPLQFIIERLVDSWIAGGRG